MFTQAVSVVAKPEFYECLLSGKRVLYFVFDTTLFTLSTCCTISNHFIFYGYDFINIHSAIAAKNKNNDRVEATNVERTFRHRFQV